jgi:hypothetical protein
MTDPRKTEEARWVSHQKMRKAYLKSNTETVRGSDGITRVYDFYTKALLYSYSTSAIDPAPIREHRVVPPLVKGHIVSGWDFWSGTIAFAIVASVLVGTFAFQLFVWAADQAARWLP